MERMAESSRCPPPPTVSPVLLRALLIPENKVQEKIPLTSQYRKMSPSSAF